TLVEAGGTLGFRPKHFAPDLRGWGSPERAVEVPLGRAARSALYFDGLTYRFTEEGLQAWVVLGLTDGGTQPARFLYPPPPPSHPPPSPSTAPLVPFSPPPRPPPASPAGRAAAAAPR